MKIVLRSSSVKAKLFMEITTECCAHFFFLKAVL